MSMDRWGQKHLGGSFSIGPDNERGIGPLIVFGYNAMHVALNLRTPWGWICFHPTWKVFGKWWPWYFYMSQDATPFNCHFKFGRHE